MIVVVPLPPLLVAVTVAVVEELTIEGVPLIAPVAVSKTIPVGRDGVIDQLTGRRSSWDYWSSYAVLLSKETNLDCKLLRKGVLLLSRL